MTNWLAREIRPLLGAIRATRGLGVEASLKLPVPCQVIPYQASGASRVGLEIDVYLPHGKAPKAGWPSVFVVHGGGFAIGSKRMKPMRVVARGLCEAGYAVLACSYPLIRGRMTLFEQVRWVSAAIERAALEGAALGLDKERSYAAGFSAGATLLLLAEAEADRARFTALAGVFGLYDFEALEGGVVRLFRRFVVGPRALSRKASPLHAERLSRPLFLLHGTRDSLVPIEQARAFAEKRRSRGLPVELVEIEGAEHAFFNYPGRPAALAGLSALIRAFGGPAAPAEV